MDRIGQPHHHIRSEYPQSGTPVHLPYHQQHSTQSFQATHLSTPPPPPPPPTQPNVQWSKLLINGVPTYASEDRGPLSPEECHEALHALNPSYATLLVTRKPSWVRTPSS